MKRRILLVESDPFLAGIYRAKLRERGYEVALASDAVQGTEQALASRPDMVVLDFVLAGMSGLHVIKKMRMHPATHATPVIVVSNHSAKEDIDKVMRAGAHAYLLKSQYTANEIANRIHAFFQNP